MDIGKTLVDTNRLILQILRYLGKENDTTLYLYDIQNHTAFFSEATARLFDIPDVVVDMPESITKRDFILPESQEEFIHLHNMVSKDALKAVGTIKMRTAKGIDTIYELRLIRILDDERKRTNVVLGIFKEITQRYIKDLNVDRYTKVLNGSGKLPITYDKKRDTLKISIPDEETGIYKDKTSFFYSKMVKDEQICAKGDISLYLDFLNNGSSKPIQMELFDQITEEYRWYALTGRISEDKPNEMHGMAEDITDLKYVDSNDERIHKVFNIISSNYLCLIEIDLIADTYEALLGDFARLKYTFPTTGKYSAANEYMSNNVNAEYQSKRLEFGSLDNIKKELKDKDRIIFKYKTADPDYPYRMSIISRIDSSSNTEITSAFFSIIAIDKCEFEETPVIPELQISTLQQKLLVIDDYELNAKLAIDSIHTAGYEADWASNLAEALGKIETSQQTYSLIFLDDKLTNISGFEVAKKIRAINDDKLANIPIILYSLKDSNDLNDACENAGINAHVAKPLAAKQIKYLCEKWIDK